MNDILAHISDQLVSGQSLNYPVRRWVVAYSGGVDSTVLLHALCKVNRQLPQPLPIIALHVNHQLSEYAADWQVHCQHVTHELGAECVSFAVNVELSGKGVEAAAREARYAVFESFLLPDDALLLGQHQQDQAETVILRLLRGAGARGLSAMRAHRMLGQGLLLRPLLTVTKETILSYAQQHQLAWVDDDSNQSDNYDRNFLRHHLFPLLGKRWPSVSGQLVNTARRMQQTDDLLVEFAQQDMQLLDERKGRWGFSICLSELGRWSYVRRNNVLRYWCETLGYPILEETHLEQIQQQFFSASATLSSACVCWKKHEVRQFSGRFYMMPSLPAFMEGDSVYQWDAAHTLALGSAGILSLDTAEHLITLIKADYTIGWRKGGERCTPQNRQQSQTVKKLLQEYQLETWLRDRVPLIYSGDELVAVGDLWVNKGFESEGVPQDVQVVNVSWSIEGL